LHRFVAGDSTTKEPNMKVCVLGAGVIGLTTAWSLTEAGHDVIIVDRQITTGAEASAANGAQLSYAFVAPLASPSTLRKLPSLLMSKDGAMRIKPTLDPEFYRWAFAFARASTSAQALRTTAVLLALAALSRGELERVATTQKLEFGLRTVGKLVVYRTDAEFQAARQVVNDKRFATPDQFVLSADECFAAEPTLGDGCTALAGGILTPSEQVADCAAFCRALTENLAMYRTVAWHLGATIKKPSYIDGRLVAIDTTAGFIEADCFVLCLGSASSAFAKSCGFHLPVYPMKGYSITLPESADTNGVRQSVTDFERKLVFAPIEINGARFTRVAGIADLVGNDLRIDPSRIEYLRQGARDLFNLSSSGDVAPWCGLRPMTPDGRPIIGWSPLDGLFLNTGHGMLGWTLACGSARLAADLIDRKATASSPGAFSLHRET
jgi:D-amino-acid dehydrogenase